MLLLAGFLLSSLSCLVNGLDNGQALSPPMGWNSWNAFRREYDRKDIENQVDAIKNFGLDEKGYVYVNVDGAWWNGNYQNGTVYRNSDGYFVDPTDKFGEGGVMKLSEKIHDAGLKFGWYTSGRATACCCAPDYPVMTDMSGGNEDADLDLFLSWGVDYLKVDNCGTGKGGKKFQGANKIMKNWAKLLDGRNITLSNSRFGCLSKRKNGKFFEEPPENDRYKDVYKSGQGSSKNCAKYANLWRVSIDIRDEWWSVLLNIRALIGRQSVAGPGQWNDPDMLTVGNTLTKDEDYSHFSLWCVTSSPLLIGTDLSKYSANSDLIKMLKNDYAIKINQEWYGHAGDRFRERSYGGILVEEWAKLLENAMGIVVLNPEYDGSVENVNVELFYEDYAEHLLGKSCYKKVDDRLGDDVDMICKVHDIWEEKDSEETNIINIGGLKKHSVSFLYVSDCYVSSPNSVDDSCITRD